MLDEEKDVKDAEPSTVEVIDAEPETPASDAAEPAEAIKTDKTPPDATGQTIPYDRFQEVVEQRNEATRILREYEAQLNEYRTRTAPPPASVKPKYTDPHTQAFYIDEIEPLVKQTQEALQLAKRAQANAEANEYGNQILKEIDGLMTHYPKSDKEWVINAIIGNPKAKIAELVKYSHEKAVSLEKKIIADYVKTKQEEAKHKAKSPAGSAPAAKSPSVKGKGWSEQLKGADEAFRAKLNASQD